MAPYMDKAVHQGHAATGLVRGVIAREAVALQVSPEVVPVREVTDDMACTGAVLVEEGRQPLCHGTQQPDVLTVGLMGGLVDDVRGRLVGLAVVAFQNLTHQRLIKGTQEGHGAFEPSSDGRLLDAAHPKMGQLPDLPVERHVVLVLLQQDLGKEARPGYALVYREQWHGAMMTPSPRSTASVGSIRPYLGRTWATRYSLPGRCSTT